MPTKEEIQAIRLARQTERQAILLTKKTERDAKKIKMEEKRKEFFSNQSVRFSQILDNVRNMPNSETKVTKLENYISKLETLK